MQKYSGELRRVGTGRIDMRYGHAKLAVLEVGDTVLKKVIANETISSYLDVGEKVDLWVGPLFLQKYIYAIRLADGRVVKMGFGAFIGSAVMKVAFLLLGSPLSLDLGGIPAAIWLAAAGFFGYRSFRAISGYLSIG